MIGLCQDNTKPPVSESSGGVTHDFLLPSRDLMMQLCLGSAEASHRVSERKHRQKKVMQRTPVNTQAASVVPGPSK